MSHEKSSHSTDSEKIENSSRRKNKAAIGILPLLIAALFFGYRQVTKELEKKSQQREEYVIEASVREIKKKIEKHKNLKGLSPDLAKDITAAFAVQRENEAFNRIVFAGFEDSDAYVDAVKHILKSGEHKTALQAAMLYCREIDASKERNKKEHATMGTCLEKFGFQTVVSGDHLTISAGGAPPEKTSARPAQGE
jgi:hypothetical protein